MLTAAEKILQKALVGSHLDSSQWNGIQAGLRDRSFFSSKVAEANILDAAQQLSKEYAEGGKDLSKIRMEMRAYLTHVDYKPDPGTEGTIKDLFSKARLDVLIKHNVDTARGFVNWADANTPGAFAAFPAQEFKRVKSRKAERKTWPDRWRAAGGQFFGGRMIARKDDPVWTKLSVFGTPYPPFDWGSGMGVRDISRKEAIRLGVITDDEIKARVEKLRKRRDDGDLPSMNGNLSAKIPFKQKIWSALKEDFGDLVKYEGDQIVWREHWTKSFIEDSHKRGFDFDMGRATAQLRKVLLRDTDEKHVKMLTNGGLRINGSWLNDEDDKHDVEEEHGRKHFGANETKLETNIPMDERDLELLPSVWRSPTRAMISEEVNTSVHLELDTFDGSVLHAVVDLSHNPRLKTFYKLKESEILKKELTSDGLRLG